MKAATIRRWSFVLGIFAMLATQCTANTKWLKIKSLFSNGVYGAYQQSLALQPDMPFWNDPNNPPQCDNMYIQAAMKGLYFGSEQDATDRLNPLTVCDFALNHCEPGGNFNFFQLYYCGMGGLNSGVQIGLFIPFALFMLFIFFYLLSDTADEYLSPALERITEMTGMSESLAGVTLLAFGNGAPDIFASIASASSATRATNTNIIGDNNSAASALLGSAFFIISVVQTLVTRAAKPDQAVKVTPVFFIRDLVSVFISLLYLLIHILFIGFINIWSSIGFFLLYLIFVIVVLITNKRQAKKVQKSGDDQKDATYRMAADFLKSSNARQDEDGDNAPFQRKNLMKSKQIDKINNTLEESNTSNSRAASKDNTTYDQDQSDNASHLKFLEEETHNDSLIKKDQGSVRVKLREGSQIEENHQQILLDRQRFTQKVLPKPPRSEKSEMRNQMYLSQALLTYFRTQVGAKGVCGSILGIIFWPLDFIRMYTMPMSSDESWSRIRASILPATQLIAFFYFFGFLNPIREDPENPTQGLPLNMIFLIVALAWMLPGGIIGIIIYFKTKSTEPPHLLLNIYAVISFIQSIAMINFAANSIVDLLQLIGFITGLPQALLSLSILAWANSLGDMSADVAMTKKGFGEMAMTATVAGPVMNILLGQGLSMMIGIISFNKGTQQPNLIDRKWEFSIFIQEGPTKDEINFLGILPLILISAAMLVIINILINTLVNNFKPGYKQSRLSVLIYVCVLAFLVFFSIYFQV